MHILRPPQFTKINHAQLRTDALTRASTPMFLLPAAALSAAAADTAVPLPSSFVAAAVQATAIGDR